MSYERHKSSECDKCLEDVGEENLQEVNFLYKDLNDKSHEDLGGGYRQYKICKDCQRIENRMELKKWKRVQL
jgi:hypothetical protein